MQKNKDKVLQKITTKGKDELKKAAVKVHKIKEDIPKKADKVKAKDQPESANSKPKVVAVEKAVPKKEEDDSEESGEESKLAAEKDDENDDDEVYKVVIFYIPSWGWGEGENRSVVSLMINWC